jgi:hypothetical protein
MFVYFWSVTSGIIALFGQNPQGKSKRSPRDFIKIHEKKGGKNADKLADYLTSWLPDRTMVRNLGHGIYDRVDA